MLNQELYYIIPMDMFDNDFAKMRNLNIIFSFCLFLDKLMEKKTKEENISGTTKKLIGKLMNINFI